MDKSAKYLIKEEATSFDNFSHKENHASADHRRLNKRRSPVKHT